MGGCRVCGNARGNLSHTFRERYLGLGDPFEYLECSVCRSLSIVSIPENMERYYPGSYYAYAPRPYSRLRGFLKGRRDRYYYDGSSVLGYLLSHFLPPPRYIEWLQNLALPYGSTILEAGSGAGTLIVNLQDAGFPSIGIDPYIAAPFTYANGARVLKQTLAETTGTFDCIMLHHCLEHIADPGETFGHVHRLLRRTGKLLVRIPVAGTHAWRTYRDKWFQIDAPRHFIIFTEAALRGLAERTGFRITKVVYDAQASQFWASEQYAQGIALTAERSYARDPGASIFSARQIGEFEKQAVQLNARNDGDQAAFYFSRAL
jgi:SAM-dependent methyltransferase